MDFHLHVSPEIALQLVALIIAVMTANRKRK